MVTDFSNDKTLKKELEKGNHQALVYLMNTYHHSLFLYVYSLSNDSEGAKDIVQNIFIKLWEERNKIHSVKSIRSFLNRAAYNGFIDEWRKDKRLMRLEAKHLLALNQILESDNQDLVKKKMELIKTEIQRLPSKCKQTFLLSKQDGLTNIEIADFMNVSVRTVETQMSKAYKILREKLKDNFEAILFFLFGLEHSPTMLKKSYIK